MGEAVPAAPTGSVEDRLTSMFTAEAATETEVTEPAPAEVAEGSTESIEGEQPEQPVAVEADSLVEVEVDGKVIKVAPDAKDYLMRHADYTKKTMELAEHRKLLTHERQMAEAQKSFEKEIAQESKDLARLESQVEQFKALDWSAMDTDQFMRARQAQDLLKDQKADLEKAIGTKRDDFVQKYSRARDQMLQQGAEYLGKTIPTWGVTAQKESAQAALNVGYTKEEVGNFMDPRAVHLAWKASQWDKLQATRPQVTQKVNQAPPVTKPGSQATTESQQSQQYRQMREKLKKSGDAKDAAALFMLRGR
jgi:hypothetical protein